MRLATRLGLSSNMAWPMHASVLCLKRRVCLHFCFFVFICFGTECNDNRSFEPKFLNTKVF